MSKGGAAPKVHSDLSCRRQFVFSALPGANQWEASREAQTSKSSVGPRGATRTEAPHRRGGEGGAFGIGRAGVESQWGQGAVRGLFIRAAALLAERAGLSNTQDAKSETTARWQITRGFQIWSQNFRARSVSLAPAKVWRAPVNIQLYTSFQPYSYSYM